MLWSEVVSRLVQQQKDHKTVVAGRLGLLFSFLNGSCQESRFCIVQDELTVVEIANIIMREVNLAMLLIEVEFSQKLFDCTSTVSMSGFAFTGVLHGD